MKCRHWTFRIDIVVEKTNRARCHWLFYAIESTGGVGTSVGGHPIVTPSVAPSDSSEGKLLANDDRNLAEAFALWKPRVQVGATVLVDFSAL